MVHFFIDEVDGHSGNLSSPGQRIAHRMGTRKSRQQGRMNIENPS